MYLFIEWWLIRWSVVYPRRLYGLIVSHLGANCTVCTETSTRALKRLSSFKFRRSAIVIKFTFVDFIILYPTRSRCWGSPRPHHHFSWFSGMSEAYILCTHIVLQSLIMIFGPFLLLLIVCNLIRSCPYQGLARVDLEFKWLMYYVAVLESPFRLWPLFPYIRSTMTIHYGVRYWIDSLKEPLKVEKQGAHYLYLWLFSSNIQNY